jgi:hypothetical protein
MASWVSFNGFLYTTMGLGGRPGFESLLARPMARKARGLVLSHTGSEATVRYQIVRTARFVQAGEDFLTSTATLEGTSLEDEFAFLCILGGLRALAVWFMIAL